MQHVVQRRWDELLGSRIEGVTEATAGGTTISLSLAGVLRTVTVVRTRSMSSSLGTTPSGAIDRVTPVFTDSSAMLTLETDRGEQLTVAGGRAWMS